MNGVVTVDDNDTFVVTLMIVDDDIIENSETYTVQVSSDNPLDNTDSTQNFTIIDVDGERYK